MLEELIRDGNRCGEGPIWDGHRLLWNDIVTSEAFELPASGERRLLSRGVPVSSIALHRSGALLFGGSAGLVLWRGPGDTRTIVEGLAINDMIASPRGGIYAGTCYWGNDGMEKYGKLYLIEAGACRVVEEGIALANGLGWSPDDRTLYFTDSATRRIYAYSVKPNGDLADRRVFVQVPADEGLPDGLTVDREGFVWSAQWYGSQIVRYDPDGKVERRIPMPVRQVSSIGFGGPAMTDLYITTAAEAWPSPLAPPGYDFTATNLGGSLYRIRLDIAGRPEHLASV